MKATRTEAGGLLLAFTTQEASEILRGIQNPELNLETEKPENVGPKWKPYDTTKPELPTKALRGKTIRVLKEIKQIAGIQMVRTNNPDYLAILNAADIRPGNFTQTLKTLEARGYVNTYWNTNQTQINRFNFKMNFNF
jgi:hypothetical protein